jgi:hypothetical protein
LYFRGRMQRWWIFDFETDYRSFYSDIKKARKWHYRVKSWVIFNKGQFTHICQLNVSCGQDSVSGLVLISVTRCICIYNMDLVSKYFFMFFFCILQDTCTWYFRLFILASAKSFASSHVSCSCPPSTPVIFPFLSVRKLPKVGPLRGNTPTFISFV